MSDTPRTDADFEFDPTTVDGFREFARTLERELTAAIERAEKVEHELVEAKADAESWRQQAEMHMQTSLAQAERAEKAESSVEHVRDWYGMRFDRLMRFCREELAEPLRTRFFAIIANGAPSWMDAPERASELLHQRQRCDQWREVAGRLYELAYPKLIMPEATPVYRAYEEMVASENGGNNG